MRFLTGNAGIVVVIVAIMGTVVVGYTLAGDTETETATDFQHTADITGLFTTSSEPEYLEYSPPENWTGWRTGSYYMQGVSYDQSARATPYIVPQPDRTAVSNGQVTGDTIDVNSALWLGSWVSVPVTNPSLVSLQDVIEGLSLGDDIVRLDIWTENGGPIISGYDMQYQTVAPFERYLAYTPDVRHATVELNDTNKRTVLYNGTGAVAATLALADIGVFYGSSANYTDAFTYQGTKDLPIIYMDPSAGVSITSSNVTWSNGYENSQLTVVIERPGTLHFEVELTNEEGLDVTVSAQAVNVSNYGGSPISFNVADAWDHFALRFDFLAGSVEFLPIVSWTDFTNYTTAPGTVYYQAVRGVADKITFHSTADNAKFGIADTIVYMDTTKVVLKDPAIDITEYWPAEDARLQFNGFAMHGDSVTINGRTYAVDDGLITIGDKTVELSNLTITWLDGRTTARIGQATFDLGETTTHAVSFGGVWYFTASYWEAHEITKEVYNWTTGLFKLGGSASILVYIGLLFVGTAILHRAQGLHGGDLLIIACAGVVGYVLLDMMA